MQSCCECCNNAPYRCQRSPRVSPIDQSEDRRNRDVWMHVAVLVESLRLMERVNRDLIFNDGLGVSMRSDLNGV